MKQQIEMSGSTLRTNGGARPPNYRTIKGEKIRSEIIDLPYDVLKNPNRGKVYAGIAERKSIIAIAKEMGVSRTRVYQILGKMRDIAKGARYR